LVDEPEEAEAVDEVEDEKEHEGEEDGHLDDCDDGVAEALGFEPFLYETHGDHWAEEGEYIEGDVERFCEPLSGCSAYEMASVFG